ncbi:MAG: DUF4097 family beta strand repeat-containing protein [Acidobacteriota bacterium]|nr:DUF4097 family beta strand repeat-containing protein [Acidobacteriota bacterium]
MRRNSFVAPLLLIALGTLLLARTLYPDFSWMDYLARNWPVILIAWGLLRIVEILYWAAAGKPLPARGLSGGEWVLIVFLCLFGLSVQTVRGVATWFPQHLQVDGLDLFNGERYEYPLNGEKAASHTPHVLLEDFRGDAKINGADADLVRVAGHKTIRGLTQREAERSNDAFALAIEGDANNVVIRVPAERAGILGRVSATLEISVPKGASVEVHGRNGDLEINDIAGSVAITSDNAGVRLKNIGGDARVDLRRSDAIHMSAVKGAVQIKGRGSDIELEDVGGEASIDGTYAGTVVLRKLAKPVHFSGTQTEFNIESVPGQVSMTLGDFTGSKLSGPTRLSGRSRDVQISDFTGPLDIMLDRGDLNLTPALPLGRIQARLRSGDIRLALPAGAQFTLNATTGNGDIANPFGGGLALETKGRQGTLRGAVGSGAAINLETRRGDIAVQQAVVAGTNTPLQKLDQ